MPEKTQGQRKATSEREIDAAFMQMSFDVAYATEAIALARSFEQSDWEAFKIGLEECSDENSASAARQE